MLPSVLTRAETSMLLIHSNVHCMKIAFSLEGMHSLDFQKWTFSKERVGRPNQETSYDGQGMDISGTTQCVRTAAGQKDCVVPS